MVVTHCVRGELNSANKISIGSDWLGVRVRDHMRVIHRACQPFYRRSIKTPLITEIIVETVRDHHMKIHVRITTLPSFSTYVEHVCSRWVYASNVLAIIYRNIGTCATRFQMNAAIIT